MLTIDPHRLDQLTTHARDAFGLQPDVSDRFHQRYRLLSPQDKLLIDMAMKYRLSRREMGLVLNIAPGAVSRRLRRVLNRLNDPLVVALIDPTCTLDPEHRQVGIEYFLHRRNVQTISRTQQRSRHEVRAMIEYVRGWHRGISSRR
jgi:hypothetical protein